MSEARSRRGRSPARRQAAADSRPGAAEVRLVCPPDVMEAVLASLAANYGDAWQPGASKPSRYDGGQVLQRGILIVPVPEAEAIPPESPQQEAGRRDTP